MWMPAMSIRAGGMRVSQEDCSSFRASRMSIFYPLAQLGARFF